MAFQENHTVSLDIRFIHRRQNWLYWTVHYCKKHYHIKISLHRISPMTVFSVTNRDPHTAWSAGRPVLLVRHKCSVSGFFGHMRAHDIMMNHSFRIICARFELFAWYKWPEILFKLASTNLNITYARKNFWQKTWRIIKIILIHSDIINLYEKDSKNIFSIIRCKTVLFSTVYLIKGPIPRNFMVLSKDLLCDLTDKDGVQSCGLIFLIGRIVNLLTLNPNEHLENSFYQNPRKLNDFSYYKSTKLHIILALRRLEGDNHLWGLILVEYFFVVNSSGVSYILTEL